MPGASPSAALVVFLSSPQTHRIRPIPLFLIQIYLRELCRSAPRKLLYLRTREQNNDAASQGPRFYSCHRPPGCPISRASFAREVGIFPCSDWRIPVPEGAPFEPRSLRFEWDFPRSHREPISSMSKPGVNIRQPKARGEWAELRFMTRAAELGLRVTKPCVVILRSALFARRRTWARRANILAFFARMRDRAFGAHPKRSLRLRRRPQRTLPPRPGQMYLQEAPALLCLLSQQPSLDQVVSASSISRFPNFYDRVVRNHRRKADRAPGSHFEKPTQGDHHCQETGPARTNSVNFRALLKLPACTFWSSSGINNLPRAFVWLVGRFSATLVRVRHLRFERVCRPQFGPGHGALIQKHLSL